MKPEAVVDYLVGWLQQKVHEAGKEGVVLGISGGVDSAAAALIAWRAFPGRVMGLLMPCESNLTDVLHGQMLVEENHIPYQIVDLDNAYLLLMTQLESYLKLPGAQGRLLRANLKPRLRMIALYYSAQARNYLVVGTSNKSEISVGYCTKYGDNAVDVQPLGDLLKHEVYELAHYLQVPGPIIDKPPSGGLWEGQTDESEMGITYEQLDAWLADGSGAPDVIGRIEAMQKASAHKRTMPPVAVLPPDCR